MTSGMRISTTPFSPILSSNKDIFSEFDDDIVLRWPSIWEQPPLVWNRELRPAIHSTVNRLTHGESYRPFMEALDLFSALLESKDSGDIAVIQQSNRRKIVQRWGGIGTRLSLTDLFSNQELPLAIDLHERIADAFRIFSCSKLNMAIWTRVDLFPYFKSPNTLFHTHGPVMALNYAKPCTELFNAPPGTKWPSTAVGNFLCRRQQVTELPPGSVAIITRQYPHRSPSRLFADFHGTLRLYIQLYPNKYGL